MNVFNWFAKAIVSLEMHMGTDFAMLAEYITILHPELAQPVL
jgi:hypothetical protein